MNNISYAEVLRRIEMFRLAGSSDLDLSHLDLAYIPDEISILENLETLNLSNNKLTEIYGLDKLYNLKSLNVSYNQLSDIKGIYKLISLSNLYISSNQLTEIEGFDKLTNLLSLNLSDNKIQEIKGLDKLANLSVLYLSGNRLQEIKGLDRLVNLWELYITGNKLTKIKGLDKLHKLSSLYLANNQLTEIEGLEELFNLWLLDLSYNQISNIKGLDNLINLKILDIQSNKLTQINGLDRLTQLSRLNLAHNYLSEIKGLDMLEDLSALNLSYNRIENIDSLSLKKVEKLVEINLSRNPIKGTTIMDWESPSAILGYLRSKKMDTQVKNYHLKVNIIGEGRIGKTQLFNYWNGDCYQPNEDATHGTLTTQFDLPIDKYRATIWDFGGQSYHHGFHHVFLRPNDFYLVLWRNNPIKDQDYGYWLGTARSFSNPSNRSYTAPVVLVQNVWSTTDQSEGRENILPDQVIFPDSQKMCVYQIGLGDVFAIDVKHLHQQNEQWTPQHTYFKSSLYRKMVEHTQNLLPEISERWLAVKERLDREPIETITLKKEEFREQYAADFDEAALAGVLDYLEFTGNIIKFPEPSSLAGYVFPNPPALSDWIYGTVLKKHTMDDGQGILKYSALEEQIGKEEAFVFREIMNEFQLLFEEKDNEDNLVIPQFLPENNTSFKRLMLDLVPYTFCLRFADFFHESRIFQFISEYSVYADDKTSYWRNGLLFNINDVNSLVYYNLNERILFVHIENKKGRTQIAQDIFDFFVTKQNKANDTGKRLWYLASKYNIMISTIQDILKKNSIEVELNPNAKVPMEVEALLDEYLKFKPRQDTNPHKFVLPASSKHKPDLIGLTNKRDKLNPDELIEGVQLSINRQNYIDIKETLRSNTDDVPVGICVKDRKRIKLDNLTLNLLGIMNQKLPKVFISYSRKDLEYKDELKTHLSILERYDLLKAWSCEEIQAGKWDDQVQTELEEADIIVYMVSQNFMASGYIMEQEVAKGIKMAEENPNKKIICVLVRNCLWKRWSFIEEKYKNVLDKNGKEVFSGDLSKYQFLPYHQYRNQEGIAVREEIVALEQWGRYPYDVSSVAFTQIAERILGEVTR